MTLDQIAVALRLGLITPRVVLNSALGTTVVDNILVPYFGGQLTIEPVTVVSRNAPEIVVAGRVRFPSSDILAPSPPNSTVTMIRSLSDLSLTVRVKPTPSGDPILTLILELPSGWTFDTSFPDMPGIFDPDSANQPSLLAYLTSTVAQLQPRGSAQSAVNHPLPPLLVLTNVAQEGFQLEDGSAVGLKAGLNFAGKLALPAAASAALGAFNGLAGGLNAPSLTLFGAITLPSAADPAQREAGTFPWDVAAVSGINLRASFNSPLNLSTNLRLDRVFLHAYSPISNDWLATHPGFDGAMGFSSALNLPGAGVTIGLAARKLPGVEDLLLAGKLDVDNSAGNALDRFKGGLSDLFGNSDALNLIPGAIPSVPRFSATVTAWLAPGGSSFTVESVTALLDFPDPGLTFAPTAAAGWPFQPTVSLGKARLLVSNPFAGAGRSFSGSLDGALQLRLGSTSFDFALRLSAPEKLIAARQTTPATLKLRDFFASKFPGIPAPPDITVQDLQLSTSSGGSFLVSMTIAQEPDAATNAPPGWKLEGSAPVRNVRVSVTNRDWHFEGEANPGIPIASLFAKLAGELSSGLGFTFPPLPEAVNHATVNSFSVSRENASGDFAVACAGQIDAGLADPIEIRLGFNHTRQPDNTFKDAYTGQVVAGGLAFELIFEKAPVAGSTSTSTFLASYKFDSSKAQGDDDPLRARLSLATVLGFAGVPSANLPAVSLELQSAFLVLRKTTRAGVSASKILVAIDIGQAIDLTGGALDELKKLGLPAGQPIELLLRLVAASNGFPPDDVDSINALLDTAGIGGLPSEKRHGDFAIPKGLDASLRLGEIVIGQDPSDVPPEPASPSAPPASPPDQTAKKVIWFNIQRYLGPLHVSRVGASFSETDSKISLLIDAGVTAAGLTLGLEGLKVSSPLNRFSPSVALDGLSVSYSNSTVEIGGAFLRLGTEFAGTAVIRTKTLSLTAFGSYQPTPPSFFVFAVLDYPLGGPSFFFVTGLAAGFGYNRDIKLPAIDQVSTFPLVSAVMPSPPPAPGAVVAVAARPTPGQMLEDLITKGWVSPLKGAYWIAVGVRFTSFQLVESFALLVVKFGQDLNITLLGLSRMALPKTPPGAPARSPYLLVELELRVSIKPNDGEFQAEARLTENSFVLHPNCRLSGGFAFYTWFKGPHEGDFVVTLGGYHPRFSPPAHYPRVQPLTINWTVAPELIIKGDAYFALTPSCVMAGGELEASYKDSAVEASFTVRADFLIRWEPFFYDIEVSISVRAGLVMDTLFGTLRLFTELSASVHVWGPEFAGTAHVSWSVISFDVDFGALSQPAAAQVLPWQAFRKAFLPKEAEAGKGWDSDGVEFNREGDKVTTQALPKLQICQVNIEQGLDREIEQVVNGTVRKQWVVRPDALELSTQTAIPATGVQYGRNTRVVIKGKSVGLRPMGGGPVTTLHRVLIAKVVATAAPAGQQNPAGSLLDLENDWEWGRSGKTQAVPKELWDTAYQPAPPTPGAEVLPDRLVGVIGLRPKAIALSGAPPTFNITVFAFDVLNDRKLLLDTAAAVQKEIQIPKFRDTQTFSGAFVEIRATVFVIAGQTAVTAAVPTARRASLVALARLNGFASLPDVSLATPGVSLAELAGHVDTIFQSEPMRGVLGSGGEAATRQPDAPELPLPAIPEDPLTTIFRILLSITQYRRATPDTRAADSDTDFTSEPVDHPFTLYGSTGAGSPDSDAQVSTLEVTGGDETLSAGQTLIIAVEHSDSDRPQSAALAFSNAAGLQFRVSTFDEGRQPLKDVVVIPSSQGTGKLPLDPASAHVVVTAVPAAATEPSPPDAPPSPGTSPDSFGWTGTTTLIQVVPHVFLCEGASMRAEAAYQQLRRDDDPESTVVRGGVAVRQNQVLVPRGVDNVVLRRSGWFNTLLPAVSRGKRLETVAVIVRRSGIPAQPGLATVVEVTRLDKVRLRLQPLHILREAPDQFVLLYRVPAGLAEEAETGVAGQEDNKMFAVFTQATGDGDANNWEIQGVVGILEKADRVRLEWDRFRLQSHVIAADTPAAAEPAQARVTIVAA